jgi:hypothetical protein
MIKFILNIQEASNKEKNKKEKKSRILGIERFIPGNSAKKCFLIHTSGNVEEIFNPLGVSLGASLESRCCHLILNSSVLGQLLAKPRGVVPKKINLRLN